jgi:hypothetical protein
MMIMMKISYCGDDMYDNKNIDDDKDDEEEEENYNDDDYNEYL